MKARKLEWQTYEHVAGMHAKGTDYYFKYHETEFMNQPINSYVLYYGWHLLGGHRTMEQAKQAAQDHADKMVADMIDPDYLLALTRFAMNEGYKNATVPMVYTAEEVLEKFKQKP